MIYAFDIRLQITMKFSYLKIPSFFFLVNRFCDGIDKQEGGYSAWRSPVRTVVKSLSAEKWEYNPYPKKTI